MTLTFQVFRNKKRLPKYLMIENCKCQLFVIFEIKRAKTDTIFNFLKGRFSVMSGLMCMIFGVFSKTNVRLLKPKTSQFFSKYSKSYTILNVKNCLKLNNCWRKQNFGNFPTWPYLYFWCTFRIIIRFCLIFGFLGCRKCY